MASFRWMVRRAAFGYGKSRKLGGNRSSSAGNRVPEKNHRKPDRGVGHVTPARRTFWLM